MSKTNHRINKDREEKLSEPTAHKMRRNAKNRTNLIVDIYEEENVEELEDFLEEDLETFVKIRRRR